MRLTWNEIRARAAAFARDWQDAHYEKGETQSFYNAFFEVFGVRRRTVAQYEHAVTKLTGTRGFVDLFWPGTLLVEQKSRGRDLDAAYAQAMDYAAALKPDQHPRHILTCDFQTFELHNLSERETARFALADLPDHVERFGFILGITRRQFRDQDPVNIRAAELVGLLHDEIKASGYTGHRLERFLVRIVFCLFADDTGIFQPKDILWDYLETRTAPDGSDTGPLLAQLFDVLNTPDKARSPNLDEDLAQFPHVNGALFAEYFPPPVFNAAMRAALLDACRFDWTPISPAIFGSLFQSVMNPAERRAKGAHYTTEANILKVIGPLFMDDLRAEFARLRALRRGRRAALERFHDRLATLTFFDPACGCGNFLIIAYRELRALEIELLKEIHAGEMHRFKGGATELPVQSFVRLDVDRFHGIEIGEFAARIAETALWMMDHIMNNRMSLEFGRDCTRLPLKKSPTIVHGDALETDWQAVLAPERCSFVLGNPPFVGAKFQSTVQREQVRRIAGLGKSGGTLDYVAAWFIKAGEYAGRAAGGDGTRPTEGGAERARLGGGRARPIAARWGDGCPRIGFVATNSITQGEQVAQLWPVLFDRCGLEIGFAHRTFPWGSEARGAAHVHVVIIGLDRRENARAERRLYSYPDPKGVPEETRLKAISPYLFDAGGLSDPHLVVREESRPVNGLPKMKTGVQMIDNGILTFTSDEHQEFLANEPDAASLFKKYIGGDEFINGHHRWILYLRDAPVELLRRLPEVGKRIAAIRKYRSESRRASTVRMADYPTHVGVDERPKNDILVVPNTSSERRDYVPIGWLSSEVIANQKLRILPDPEKWVFALLTSKMHMAWMRAITGRMKSDYMYSIGVVYNTFPLPKGDLSKLAPLAQAVLDARAAHPGSTLADLYDPDLMPADLRRAHGALDRAVDRMYRRAGFASDRERVEHLFGLYEAMVKPLLAKPGRRRRRG